MIKYSSINRINIDYKPNKIMNISDNYKKVIDQIISRAEFEMNNCSYYHPIEELANDLEPKFLSRTIKFKIVQDEENFDKHFFEVVMLQQNSQPYITRPLAYGDKETIIRYLKNPDAIKNISGQLKQMAQDLR